MLRTRFVQQIPHLFASVVLALPLFASAQVSVVSRNQASYTQDVFNYAGSRVMMVDEVNIAGSEDNVYIFSKPDAGVSPDVLYFQQYQKVDGKFKRTLLHAITHDGLLSIWKSRKVFTDADKDRRVDAFFVYSKHTANKTQTSTHMLISHNGVVYTLSANKADEYMATAMSENFGKLDALVKEAALKYWTSLDKE